MEPLASKLRPKKLSEVISQNHLTNDNSILNMMINKQQFHSIILSGPPGTGKSTIGHILLNSADCNTAVFNASKDNKAKLKEIILNSPVLLLVDEIHRLKKDVQDFLLEYLESGEITLIGLTTANPYHSINKSIRSRTTILTVKPINKEQIFSYLKKIADSEYQNRAIDEKILRYIAEASCSEIRTSINMLEMLMLNEEITLAVARQTFQKTNLSLGEDDHYDLLSGLQKSIRGSDVNASLHYLAKLILLDDLHSITRRLMVIAYEDIGLANPNLGVRANAVTEIAFKLGFPEARIPLSQLVIELALSPKSNSAYLAIDKALKDISAGNSGSLPNNLKNRKLYKYPHDFAGKIVNQQYFPTGATYRKYFEPTDSGSYEETLKNRYQLINKYFKIK